MYHVSKDARAKKSAELICKGLEECLQEKPLNKIRVVDIYEKSFVSRATFYRLFDCIEDVFAYECDTIRSDTMKMMRKRTFTDKHEQSLYIIKRWLAHETLMRAMVDNNLFGVFYDSHMRNAGLLKQIYANVFKDDQRFDYFASILASLIYASLSIYFKHGAGEPIEEVYHTVCRCTGIIAENIGE